MHCGVERGKIPPLYDILEKIVQALVQALVQPTGTASLYCLFLGVLLTIPIMMMIIMFCYKKNFCGLINVSRSPADFSRSFYKRAEMNDDQYI